MYRFCDTNESAFDGSNNSESEDRELRGGSWFLNSVDMVASARADSTPYGESFDYGFRVASVPEPSSGLFALLGLSTVLMIRRSPRKQMFSGYNLKTKK